MKRWATGFGLAAMFVTTAWMLPALADQPDGVAKFMRPKLGHAQRVLEGLALEDYTMIGKSAAALAKLAEAAEWQVLPDPEYVRYSSDFQRICNDLAVAADKKNLDAATLSYVQLAMNCVDCHQHVRDVRRVALAP